MLLVCLALFSLLSLAVNAQAAGFQTDILQMHNVARARHGVAPLVWDSALASTAEEWSAQCSNSHSTAAWRGGKAAEHRGETYNAVRSQLVGENIAARLGIGQTAFPYGMDFFLGERQYWTCETGACNGPTCGHYTQVMWARTTKVGCFLRDCYSGPVSNPGFDNGRWSYLVCNYGEAGNYNNEPPFPRDQCTEVATPPATTTSNPAPPTTTSNPAPPPTTTQSPPTTTTTQSPPTTTTTQSPPPPPPAVPATPAPSGALVATVESSSSNSQGSSSETVTTTVVRTRFNDQASGALVRTETVTTVRTETSTQIRTDTSTRTELPNGSVSTNNNSSTEAKAVAPPPGASTTHTTQNESNGNTSRSTTVTTTTTPLSNGRSVRIVTQTVTRTVYPGVGVETTTRTETNETTETSSGTSSSSNTQISSSFAQGA